MRIPPYLTKPLAPPAALRPLYRVGGSLVAGVMLVVGTGEAVTRLAHEEETLVSTLDDVSGVELLDVDNGAGPVEIVGTDADSVTITAHVSDGLRETGHGHRIEGDTLVVEGSCPVVGSSFCSVRYTIEVPARMAVRADSDDWLRVSDVEAPVEASASNGSIEVARVRGDVRLDSANGRVTAVDLESGTAIAESANGLVELDFAESPRTVVARSANGPVDIVLPDEQGVAYAVVADSDNGGVDTPVRANPHSSRTITADSDNGSVSVRYGDG